MQQLRTSLARLGWPIDSLSDQEVGRELYHRWFEACPNQQERERTVGIAALKGIFASFAAEGNLDALGWSTDEPPGLPEDVVALEPDPFELPTSGEPASRDPEAPERRSAPRHARSELIEWKSIAEGSGSSGWVLDQSADGLAFVVDAQQAPPLGAEVSLTVHARTGEQEVQSARVVRTELLRHALGLVCVRFEG